MPFSAYIPNEEFAKDKIKGFDNTIGGILGLNYIITKASSIL